MEQGMEVKQQTSGGGKEKLFEILTRIPNLSQRIQINFVGEKFIISTAAAEGGGRNCGKPGK